MMFFKPAEFSNSIGMLLQTFCASLPAHCLLTNLITLKKGRRAWETYI
jgi:hypothetical protein